MIVGPRTRAGFIVAFALVTVVIRAVALDRLVTPDESRWLGRSANFYQALATKDFASTYQFVHPGVPVMWLGTLGFLWAYPSYVNDVPGQIEPVSAPIEPILLEHGHDPRDMLIAARMAKLAGEVIVLAVAFALGIRLLGLGPATLGFCLASFDPFALAHGRLLHIDSMASAFTILSLIAVGCYLFHGRQRRDLIVSGAAAAFAWLTRSPALILAPYTALLLAMGLWPTIAARRFPGLGALWSAVRPLLVWSSVGLAVTVVVWPALWVAPTEILRQVFGWAIHAAQDGHEEALFFNGQIYTGDPGWSFYPVTYLWRASPITLIGLLAVVVGFVAPRTRLVTPVLRGPILGLGLFAVMFMLFMSLGDKKFDRYVLPSYLPLDVVAGVGWFGVASVVYQRGTRTAQFAGATLAGAVILVQIGLTATAYPYYLSYYNPLLGGVSQATNVMLVGWGEGLDQAADFIKDNAETERPDWPPLVRTTTWPAPIDYFLPMPTERVSSQSGMAGVLEWIDTDYLVTYIAQWQRNRGAAELLAFLDSQTPAHTVTLQGIDYARVYDLTTLPLPDYLLRDHPCAVDFGRRTRQVRFVAARGLDTPQQPESLVEVTTYFTTIVPTADNFRVRLRLIADDGGVVAKAEHLLVPAHNPGMVSTARLAVQVAATAPPGPYAFELSIRQDGDGKIMPGYDTQTGESLGPRVGLEC
jgi:hypothetical protein